MEDLSQATCLSGEMEYDVEMTHIQVSHSDSCAVSCHAQERRAVYPQGRIIP